LFSNLLCSDTQTDFSGQINHSHCGYKYLFHEPVDQHAAIDRQFFDRGIGAHAMKIYYNADTRQLIIIEQETAVSIYLQSDETPARKAEEIIKAFHENPKNVSICRQIIPDHTGNLLPVEEGTDRLETTEKGKTANGDDKTE